MKSLARNLFLFDTLGEVQRYLVSLLKAGADVKCKVTMTFQCNISLCINCGSPGSYCPCQGTLQASTPEGLSQCTLLGKLNETKTCTWSACTTIHDGSRAALACQMWTLFCGRLLSTSGLEDPPPGHTLPVALATSIPVTSATFAMVLLQLGPARRVRGTDFVPPAFLVQPKLVLITPLTKV